jgi:hypothetical protein
VAHVLPGAEWDCACRRQRAQVGRELNVSLCAHDGGSIYRTFCLFSLDF